MTKLSLQPSTFVNVPRPNATGLEERKMVAEERYRFQHHDEPVVFRYAAVA